METTVRCPEPSVISTPKKQTKQYWKGEFSQLVRFLLNEKQVLKFEINSCPNFHSHEVDYFVRENGQCKIVVNFMGLIGHHGVLPSYYQSEFLRALREQKGVMLDFLNIFQNRLTTLYYQSWLHSRPTLNPRPVLNDIMASLAGGLSPNRLPNQSLLNYAGLLRRRPLSRLAIETILSDYFELPLRVNDFQDSKLSLPENEATKIGMQQSKLGISMVLGDKVRQQQGRCIVDIGPLNQSLFLKLLPDKPMAQEVCRILRYLVPRHIEVQVRLLLLEDSVPKWQLSKNGPGRLGLTTWCLGHPLMRIAKDVTYAV
jgi:type VI secretion system protein ImpH